MDDICIRRRPPYDAAHGRPSGKFALPILIAVITIVDALLLRFGNFTLAWRSEWPALVACTVLPTIWAVYRWPRPEPRLSQLASDTLRFVVFTNVACVLSYLLTGLCHLPLHDLGLDRADLWLGFHWRGYWHWVHARPVVLVALTLAYDSAILQLALLLIVFALLGRRTAADELFYGFAGSALVTIAVGVLFPASGASLLHHVANAADEPMRQYLAQRDGSLRRIDLMHPQGLVWFPSFHAALAGLFVYAARRVRGLFWPLLPLNLIMLAACPVLGGHYLVDLVAGLALIAATMVLLARYRNSVAPESRALRASSRCGVPTSDHTPP